MDETEREDVELFLDDERVSWMHNVERRLCQPEKYAGNPIVAREYPWETHYVTVYGSVLPGEDGRGFRMWYMAGAKGMRADQTMCYAESDDGFAWRKPMFDYRQYGEHEQTNILLGPDPNIHGPCVIRNAHNDDPDERYLAFYDSYTQYRPNVEELRASARWCYTATSPDGLAWEPSHGRPAVIGKSDVGQSVVWDPVHRRYIAYMRGVRSPHRPFDTPYGESRRVRYVRAAVSDDFLHWSDPIELLRADEQDGDPDHHFHQFSVTRRGGYYIGLLSIFHIDGHVEFMDEDSNATGIMEEGTCDTQLAVSRDGLRWERVADRQIFLPLGGPGQWDSQWNVTASQFVYDGDRMLFYYASTDRKRSQRHKYRIGVATLPRDRFQAVRPRRTHQHAVLETVPLYLEDGDLRINADATHGKITVELCDFNGGAIEGFAKEDCEAVETDGLDHVVRWNGKGLSDARNGDPFRKALRIRFYIHHASLYAAYLPQQRDVM